MAEQAYRYKTDVAMETMQAIKRYLERNTKPGKSDFESLAKKLLLGVFAGYKDEMPFDKHYTLTVIARPQSEPESESQTTQE